MDGGCMGIHAPKTLNSEKPFFNFGLWIFYHFQTTKTRNVIFSFGLDMCTNIKGRSKTLKKRPGRILEGDAHVLVIDKQAIHRCG